MSHSIPRGYRDMAEAIIRLDRFVIRAICPELAPEMVCQFFYVESERNHLRTLGGKPNACQRVATFMLLN
jgi:hypothetical protein